MINQHPEKQIVFTRPRTVPGDRSYSDAARIKVNKSNNTNIKIFSDSIPGEIRIRNFNRFIKSGNARLYGFPGASSKQLSYYIDVNLDNTTDTVIIHVGINDILHGSSIEDYMKNVRNMVNKCYSFGVKRVFMSGIVYTKRVSLQLLIDTHEQLTSLCKELKIKCIDNRNISDEHLFKDGLHLIDSGKTILANNFICNLNNFLIRVHQPQVFI